MEWLQLIVLAVLQGLTEFLPISSSAHLVLVPALTQWPDQGLAFDVALHLGSLFAVVIYFRRELQAMALNWLRSLPGRPDKPDARLAWAVLLATIPVGLAGLTLREQVESALRAPTVIAAALIGFGLLLGWADRRHRGERSEYQIGWRDILVVGGAQVLALIPGTSRSGITMTAALMMGMSRESAARFSFLLAIPVIIAACALETRGLLVSGVPVDWLAMLTGVLVSGVSAWLCIHAFLNLVQRIGMMPFVVYRVLLGLLLLWFSGVAGNL